MGRVKEKLYEWKNHGKEVETCLQEAVALMPGSRQAGNASPLRILYAALQFEGNKPQMGFSYEENNFCHTLYNMGHDLIRFDFGQLRRHYGLRMMNRMLLETAFRYDPDVLFFVIVNDKIGAAELQEITDNMRTITVNYNSDDQWRFDDFTSRWAACFNWNITTSEDAIPKYQNIGYDHVIYSQWACNHYLYKPLDLPKRYDVTFIGQPHGIRREFIEKLQQAGIKVDVWGSGWGHGRVSLMDMVRIYNQSRINLNISATSTGGVSQIKGRDFEVPGTGSFLLTGYSAELTKFYVPGRDVIAYRNIDDAVDKIRYYLQHADEREKIASQGYAATLANNTYKHRFDNIFAKIGVLK